jgi:monoterpene epsilon-lactone hydrolase
MVMASRPEVEVASAPVALVDLLGLAGAFAGAALRIPLRAPWHGTSSPLRNVAVASTREFVRSLMGYVTALPIDEFRAVEKVLDEVSGVLLRPFVAARRVGMTSATVGGLPGLWFRPEVGEAVGTIVYVHGGGYIGTSPGMYAVFMAHLARTSQCEVFVADYRLAPEFPYPAASDDIAAVIRELVDTGIASDRLFLAGDSSGGGLASSVLASCALEGLAAPAALILFSPEVSLVLDQPSVSDNAKLDILPWNIPTNPYLHGADPNDPAVSALRQPLAHWPPTFVVYGGDEMFRDAIREFVDRLDEAGVDYEAHEVPGMFHVFPFLLPWTAESRETYRWVGEFLTRVAAGTAKCVASSPPESDDELAMPPSPTARPG